MAKHNAQLEVKLVFGLSLSVLLMLWDMHGAVPKLLKQQAQWLVTPLYWVIDYPDHLLRNLSQYVTGKNHLIQVNQHLKQENFLLRVQTLKMMSVQQENQHLKTLLKAQHNTDAHFVAAEVTKIDPDPFSLKFLVNRGQQQNVLVGDPVVDAFGIVGQVVSTGPLYSWVLLLTDRDHAIPVENQRNGLRAIAVGSGKNTLLKLHFVPNTYDFAAGDQLVSSGLGGRFPRGYPVGVVTEVVRDPNNSFATVWVKPLAALDSSRIVMMVKK